MMKKLIKMKNLWIIFLIVIWLLPIFDMYFSVDIFVFGFTFLLSILLYKFINKRAISFFVILILTVIVSIYKVNYIVTVLPIFLLIVSHSEIFIKGKAVHTDNIYETLSILLFTTNFFYSVIELSEREIRVVSHIKSAIECLLWIILLFVALLIVVSRSKTEKKAIRKKLQYIYMVALFGLSVSAFSYFAQNGQGNVKATNAEFLYWYIFVLVLLGNNDPYVRTLVEKTEKYFNKYL